MNKEINIKKFHFSRGQYHSFSFELNYKKRVFYYTNKSDEFFMQMNIDPVLDEYNTIDNVHVQLNDKSGEVDIKENGLVKFIEFLNQECSHWKPDYNDMPACDGETWEVYIKTDDFKFKSEGFHQWPNNFNDFLAKLELLTGKLFSVDSEEEEC